MRKKFQDIFHADRLKYQWYNLVLEAKIQHLKPAFSGSFLLPIVPYLDDCGLLAKIFYL